MLVGMVQEDKKENIEKFFDIDIPNLPYELKKTIIEFGIPFDVIYAVIAERHKESAKIEKEIEEQACFMQEFYEEDEELTEFTKHLECEGF